MYSIRLCHLLWVIAVLAASLGMSFTTAQATTRAHIAQDGHRSNSSLSLLSAHSVLVFDRDSASIIFEKNSRDLCPIASITKLMVAITVLESGVDLNERIVLTGDDDRASRGIRRSRLRLTRPVTRDDLLKLMLMSSENKAAYALARSHPLGYAEFIRAMNDKAEQLGMANTRFTEPTGLSDENVSTAWDLKTLLLEADRYPIIKDYSTRRKHEISSGARNLQYINSNRLVREGSWDIQLQKTGTTTKAGRCVAMLANLTGRPLVIVLLRAQGKLGRVRDAQILKTWMETGHLASVPKDGLSELR